MLITTRWSRWESNSRRQTTDDAYLQSDLTPIAAKVSGYVRSMPVQDYERVHEGQLIAEIVDDDYRATVDQLTASVAAAAAQIEALKAQQELQSANVQAAKASVAAVDANAEQNKRDLARQAVLFKTGSSSTEAAEKLQTVKAQLAAQLEQTRAQAGAAVDNCRCWRLNRHRRKPPWPRRRPASPLQKSTSDTPASWRLRTASSGNGRSSRDNG